MPWDGRKTRSNRRAGSLLSEYRVFPEIDTASNWSRKELADETDSYHFGERLDKGRSMWCVVAMPAQGQSFWDVETDVADEPWARDWDWDTT